MNRLTRLLNVDLELVSRNGVDPLLAHFSGDVLTLRDSQEAGLRVVWLELARDPLDLDAALRTFAQLVVPLPSQLRDLWDGCDDRCFNVGIQAEARPHASAFRVSEQSIGALAAMSARLEFTVYGAEPDTEKGRSRI